MAKTEISLTGSFNVELNTDKTEAFLVMTTGSATDKVWTLSDIIGLVQTSNISGVKIDELSKQLAFFEQKREKGFRISVSKGSIGIPPMPEIFQSVDLKIPEHLEQFISKALAASPAAEIFQEIQFKVEKEKVVVKKAVLPFLPEKAEMTTVIAKESRLERIYIDPTLIAHGFVYINQKIGTIIPAKSGLPGKTVSGEIIPTAIIAEPFFHPGAGISRKGNELSADCTGILRIGNNWTDIVPFAEHTWTLSQSNDKATCFLQFSPGSRLLPPVSAEEIVIAAQKLEYKIEDLLSADEISTLIRESIDLGHTIEHHSISQAQDSFIDIIVSDDQLKAVLNVTKGSGHGKALVLKELGKAINESGLSINKEKIKIDIPAWFNGPEKSLIAYILAEGKAPQIAPKQSASFSVTFLEGKEYEQMNKYFATLDFENMTSFPKDCISGIAKIEKEQRVLTLGPLVLGASGTDVYGKILPGKPGDSFPLQLYGNLELTGQSLVVAKKPGFLLKAEKDGKTFLAAFEHLDGEILIELADNNMTAYIAINAHRGTGKVLKREDILAEIQKSGVSKGIETEILEKIVTSSENEHDISRICFARGQAPTSGKPSEIRYLVNFASGQNVTLRKDGTADFRNQDRITTIKKDTHIAEILPNNHISEPGWDVCGKEIPPTTIQMAAIEVGTNIRQSILEDGRTLLIAEQDGELRKVNNRIDIIASYTLKGNVDATTGNIKFPGAVQIAGDVITGFYIIAGGEIKIAGNVEGALLSADQDILIQNGVKGSGKAVLRTKKGIIAGFIEQATVLAVGDIKIKKTLLRSHVKCNGRLIMGDDSHLIGGQIKVKLGLITGELGSSSGTRTHIFFGQDILVEDLIEVEEKEISKLQEDLSKLNTAMRSSEKLNNKDQLQDLFNEKVKSMKILEKRNLRIFTLKERFEQHFESEIIVKGNLYPGVILESHGRTHEINKLAKGVRIRFDTSSGRITEEPLSKNP